MIYTLYIWTAVAMAGDRHMQVKAMDWRPNGQYESSTFVGEGFVDGRTKCDEAARQLGLKHENYRCVRSK
jgi:hypothetical protein